jgi:hypothetical protein
VGTGSREENASNINIESLKDGKSDVSALRR